MHPTYDPQPVPRELVDDLEVPLVEEIAAKVHDAWAFEKRKQGKHQDHPDWIPYEELPDNVKEYDRTTVRTVLAALVQMGYAL